MAVDFKITFDESFIKSLQKLESSMQDASLKRLLDNIGTEMRESTVERISETKTGPDGKKWDPLSPETLKRKNGRGSILIDGGGEKSQFLRANISYIVESNLDIIVGTNVSYAEVHQKGSDILNIPARPFLGISKEDEKIIDRIIERHFKEAT